MSGLEYVQIPQCATPIQDDAIPARPKLVASILRLPSSDKLVGSPSRMAPTSPSKQPLNISHLLLSSSLNFPTPPPASPRDGALLLSSREPLSLPTMTVNFRRFVSKSGPLFWLQDRIEEIIMWRKGWKVTCTWMAIYAFLCYFPQIVVLLPHIVVISVLLTTHNDHHSDNLESSGSEKQGKLPTQQPKEGTVDWYANLQAIQNLMGAIADLYDAAVPFLPLFTWETSNTSQVFSLLCLSMLLLVPVVLLVPLRPLLLCLGLLPFVVTHPYSLHVLPQLLRPLIRSLKSRAQKMIDNDNLLERHWYTDMREINLWENERWNVTNGWSKSNLKQDERKPWTSGCDGWSDIVAGVEDIISTTQLSPGYEFVETEDWRVDFEESSVDDDGWLYTNDSWLDPHHTPKEEWKWQSMTRRRRWIRRVYLSSSM